MVKDLNTDGKTSLFSFKVSFMTQEAADEIISEVTTGSDSETESQQTQQ